MAVVGGTDGLGRAIAKLAAAHGAGVIVAGRTFRDEGNTPPLEFRRVDLSLTSEAARLGRELPASLDVVVFTTGIMPGAARKASGEGIELDMAVSCLSRHVALKELMPRLSKSARVFVMGFPGAGQKAALDDMNSEKSYAGGLSQAHNNTVAGNEALVRYWGAARGAKVYGLNPGLISTGIRAEWLPGMSGRVMEWLVSCASMSAEQYAERVLPLMVAPELDAHPGASFSQKGVPILPSAGFTDAAYVDKIVASLDALVDKAKANVAAAGGAKAGGA